MQFQMEGVGLTPKTKWQRIALLRYSLKLVRLPPAPCDVINHRQHCFNDDVVSANGDEPFCIFHGQPNHCGAGNSNCGEQRQLLSASSANTANLLTSPMASAVLAGPRPSKSIVVRTELSTESMPLLDRQRQVTLPLWSSPSLPDMSVTSLLSPPTTATSDEDASSSSVSGGTPAVVSKTPTPAPARPLRRDEELVCVDENGSCKVRRRFPNESCGAVTDIHREQFNSVGNGWFTPSIYVFLKPLKRWFMVGCGHVFRQSRKPATGFAVKWRKSVTVSDSVSLDPHWPNGVPEDRRAYPYVDLAVVGMKRGIVCMPPNVEAMQDCVVPPTWDAFIDLLSVRKDVSKLHVAGLGHLSRPYGRITMTGAASVGSNIKVADRATTGASVVFDTSDQASNLFPSSASAGAAAGATAHGGMTRGATTARCGADAGASTETLTPASLNSAASDKIAPREFTVQWFNGCTKVGDSGSLLELLDDNFLPLKPRRILIGSLCGRAKFLGDGVTMSTYTSLAAMFDIEPALRGKYAEVKVYPVEQCNCMHRATQTQNVQDGEGDVEPTFIGTHHAY